MTHYKFDLADNLTCHSYSSWDLPPPPPPPPRLGLYHFGYFQKRLTYLQNRSVFSLIQIIMLTYFSYKTSRMTWIFRSRNGYVVLIRIFSFIIFENLTQHQREIYRFGDVRQFFLMFLRVFSNISVSLWIKTVF